VAAQPSTGSESDLKPVTLPRGARLTGDGAYTITSGRPLAIAAQIASEKLGVPISYEDASWMAGADLVAVPAPQPSNSRGPGANGNGPVEPREHVFDFSIPSNARELPAEAVLQSILDRHHAARNPGDFRIVRFGKGEYSIVADYADDKSGKRSKQVAPLDVRISLASKRRTLEEAIADLSAAIKAASGITLTSAQSFGAYFTNSYIEIGANNRVARDVLAEILGPSQAPGLPPNARSGWMIFYEPTIGIYFLNLYDIREEVSKKDGTKALRALVWSK
jgi:hypothetical protein